MSVGFNDWAQNQKGLISHGRVGREHKEEGLTEWHKAWAVLTGNSCFGHKGISAFPTPSLFCQPR